MLKPSQSSALSGSSFQAGNIISDSVFTNYNAMSAADIQTFLSAQMPNCDTNGTELTSHSNGSGGYYTRAQWGAVYDAANNTTIAAAPYVCLKDYVENPTTNQNNLASPGTAIAGGMSAAQIIADRAVTYDINPEVILTTLQKEQGLVTDDWPWANEYQEAMGYDCPDTPQGCSSTYAGFYKQVDSAAKQFRYYLDHPNAFNYWIGDNVISYSPSCAGTHVTIQNAATAALYIYTPYQPDSNVISSTNPTGSASGPGPAVSGDSCAAYGNRNFWWYFNTWFGPSVGDLVKVSGDPTVYLLSGTTAYPINDVNVLNDFSALGPVRTTTLGEINSYTGGQPLRNIVGSSNGTLYLVNANIKLPFNNCSSVTDYGYACDSTKIPYLTDGQLALLTTGPQVTPLLRGTTNTTVYYITGGVKRPVDSWSDIQSFHIPLINTLTDAFVNEIPPSSAVVYGSGALVKTLNSPTVYIVEDLNNVVPISNFIYPQELGLGTNVRTIISYYGVQSSVENSVQCNSINYVGTEGAEYPVSASMLTAYGFTQNQFVNVGRTLCSNLPISVQPLTQYIRVPEGTIYYVSGGLKQAYTSYQLYLAHGGTAANTIQVSDFFANQVPTGAPITQ
jgi:hypothetical protein